MSAQTQFPALLIWRQINIVSPKGAGIPVMFSDIGHGLSCPNAEARRFHDVHWIIIYQNCRGPVSLKIGNCLLVEVRGSGRVVDVQIMKVGAPVGHEIDGWCVGKADDVIVSIRMSYYRFVEVFTLFRVCRRKQCGYSVVSFKPDFVWFFPSN